MAGTIEAEEGASRKERFLCVKRCAPFPPCPTCGKEMRANRSRPNLRRRDLRFPVQRRWGTSLVGGLVFGGRDRPARPPLKYPAGDTLAGFDSGGWFWCNCPNLPSICHQARPITRRNIGIERFSASRSRYGLSLRGVNRSLPWPSLCATTREEIETRRNPFIRKWRLQAPRRRRQPGGSRRPPIHLHPPTAEPVASARTTNAIERLHEGVQTKDQDADRAAVR